MSIFPTKILLATDGSKEARLAARTAVVLADKTDSELHVVNVGLQDYGYPIYAVPELEEVRGIAEEVTKEARKLLDAEVEQVEAAGGSVAKAHLGIGRPEVEIVRLAEEIGAGLIVMGSRGRGGIGRSLMGSVSDSVVRHAHCPVMVVRVEKG
jgi:nucleotide-binding universal stress UspA family protein